MGERAIALMDDFDAIVPVGSSRKDRSCRACLGMRGGNAMRFADLMARSINV